MSKFRDIVSILAACLLLVFQSFPASADSVNLDEPDVKCDAADTPCLKYLKELRDLHWKKHKVTLDVAVATQMQNLSAQQKTHSTNLKTIAEEKLEAFNKKKELEAANRVANLSGLAIETAVLQSNNAAATFECDASPYIRYQCADGRTRECGTTGKPDCPTKFSCQLAVKDQPICYISQHAAAPAELNVVYSCNGGEGQSLSVSALSNFAYFSCPKQ